MEYRQRRMQGKPQGKRQRVFTPHEEEEPASTHYTGHYAGLHGEDTRHVTTADVRSHLAPKQTRPAYEPDELEAGQRIRSIVRQYNGIPMPDGMLYRQGNEQVYVHRGPPPQRASRGKTRTTENVPAVSRKRRRFRWLFWVGLVLLVMIVGYVGLGAFGSWWTNHQNDVTYGYPRTFQVDSVVGHHDSTNHPSHFIAVNLKGRITIIEIPGGDVSKSVIYTGPTLLGDGSDLTPVTLSFSHSNGNGKPNMLVHVADQTIVFLNNGTKFVPPANIVSDGESNLPIQGGGE
ncbi:MAG TPA: hypothetical protein VFV38_14725 [Ktedonobacteraceae bacterium]|nr:hypothetical protein [Ktedonobacteraceae bacterium]